MNSPIRRISVLIAALFCALFVSATIVQYFQAPSLRARPDNKRTLLDNYSRDRGAIIVGNDQVAKSVPAASTDELKYLRTYDNGPLYAAVTGYYSYVYGAGGGLENSSDALLSGTSDSLFYRRMIDMLTGKSQSGASLQLTIDPRAQAAAAKGLGNQRGAVVAINPKTGAILALYSSPSYDPNTLTSHDANSVTSAWAALNADKTGTPLVNRAIGGNTYFPGSTFKIVTAAAALDSGAITPSTPIPAPAALDLPQTNITLPNYDHRACGPNDQTSLQHALEISCNSAFGWIGLKVGGDALRAQAQKFGFGDSLQIPTRVTPSTFPDQLNAPQTAQSAIGQYDVKATPLQMAMVAAAIANKGVEMKPYLIQSVLGPNLESIDTTTPEQLSQATTAETAATLTAMLTSVVDNGTGKPAAIPGVKVAGKTGTAEQGNGKPPHAWFVSFAPSDNPQVAVAVVVEDGGNAGDEAAGGRTAGPIAKAVMQAVMGQ